MTRAAAFACMAAVLVLAAGGRAIAAGVERFAVVVGNNRGSAPDRTLRYARADAHKVAAVLAEIGGFARRNTVVLEEPRAERVWRSLRELAERARAAKRRKPGLKTMLLFYYSGHAEGDVLQLGSTTLRFDRLKDFIRTAPADVRLAFIDSCQSGTLVAIKGGRRGPAFNLRLDQQLNAAGYAIVTSSSQSELSQEAAEIRGSYFTHYLVSALRGAGDRTGDQQVTLAEAYQYVYSRTVARTSVTVGGPQHPGFDWNLSGRGEVVLTRARSEQARLTFAPRRGGRLVLLDRERQQVIAEAELARGRPMQISVRPGVYWALVLEKKRARIARLAPRKGQNLRVGPAVLRPYQLQREVAKGGLFRPEPPAWSHRLGAGFILRRATLDGTDLAYGAGLHYRLRAPGGWQPVVQLAWTQSGPADEVYGYFDLSVLAGVGYVLSLAPVQLRLELLAGYEHLLQEVEGGERRDSGGFGYLGQAGAEVELGPAYATAQVGVGGRGYQVASEGWVHRFDWQVFTGIGLRWEQ